MKSVRGHRGKGKRTTDVIYTVHTRGAGGHCSSKWEVCKVLFCICNLASVSHRIFRTV